MDNNITQTITPNIINHFFLEMVSFSIKYDPIIVIIIELECIGCAIATGPSTKQNLKDKLAIKSNNIYENNKYNLFIFPILKCFQFLVKVQ